MGMSYEVSDGLMAFRRWFAEYDQTGITLSGEDVRELRRQLGALTTAARKLEHEISRHRWNEHARTDLKRLAEQEQVVLAEAARPGGNVLLLGRMAMPFSDGRKPS